MNITKEQSDQLLKEVYALIHESQEQNTSREEFETRLKQVLDLSWTDNNLFESYFEEFSAVIQAMHNMDFSKRLPESDDKTAFLNLIAQSLNLVNQELEDKYLSVDLISMIAETLKVNNRIILISKDKKKVNYACSNIKTAGFDVKALQDQYLESFIDSDHFSEIYNSNEYEYTGKINHEKLNALPKENMHLNIRNNPSYMVITMTVFPEHQLITYMPRILSLISSLKEQFEDNPQITESLVGYSNSLEINSLYAELKAYMEKELTNLQVD